MGFPDNLGIWILAGMLGLFGYVDETRGQTLVTIAGTELPDGTRISVWRVCDGLSATDSILSNPFSVSVGVSGRIYIADSSHNRVRVIDESGRIRGEAGTGAIRFQEMDHLRVRPNWRLLSGCFSPHQESFAGEAGKSLGGPYFNPQLDYDCKICFSDFLIFTGPHTTK